jgi:hypothetical protein
MTIRNDGLWWFLTITFLVGVVTVIGLLAVWVSQPSTPSRDQASYNLGYNDEIADYNKDSSSVSGMWNFSLECSVDLAVEKKNNLVINEDDYMSGCYTAMHNLETTK